MHASIDLSDSLLVAIATLLDITKTCLYNFGLDEAVLTSTHNLCFEQKYEKYLNLLYENFHFFGGKIFSIFV